MPTCLLGLGSNLGDREATLRRALADIQALPNVQIIRHSEWHRSRPVGGPAGQGEFLNGAAVIETTITPLPLLSEFKTIESRHGRQPGARWSPRTLDIDLLLYGTDAIDTEMLTVPHPRMSFRRFVLEPAAQVAPKMLHPTTGWAVERLLLHLNRASDQAALVSPSESWRNRIANGLRKLCGAQVVARPTFATAEHHWPSSWTTWLALRPSPGQIKPVTATPTGLPYAAAAFPKLTILVEADLTPAHKLHWATLVRQPGRGPTLRVQSSDQSEIVAEVVAAIDAVWPDLGPPNANRLES